MHMQTRVALIAAGLLAACAPRPDAPTQTTPGQGQPETPAPTGPSAGCTPLETRDASSASQQPAFAGQTRACGVRSDVAFDVAVVARGLNKPWSVEPLPDGSLLVT